MASVLLSTPCHLQVEGLREAGGNRRAMAKNNIVPLELAQSVMVLLEQLWIDDDHVPNALGDLWELFAAAKYRDAEPFPMANPPMKFWRLTACQGAPRRSIRSRVFTGAAYTWRIGICWC